MPIIDVWIMHSVAGLAGLPNHKCASCWKSLKIQYFAICEIGV